MTTAPASTTTTSTLGRLERMLADRPAGARPPVHLWDPPARPDIGLAIEHDGTWTHQGDPFTRDALTKLFASVLRREPDGTYVLVTPVEKVPVRVADVPFMAVEMEVRGRGQNQKIIWRTNVDDVVIAGAKNPIRFEEEAGGGLKPYVTVRDDLEARVTRSLWVDLVDLAETATMDGTEKFGVWSDGAFFAMADAAALDDVLEDSVKT